MDFFRQLILIACSLTSLSASALPIVTYSTFGPNDHYSTKGGTNGFSLDIGQDYSQFDRHYSAANGFTLNGGNGSLTLESIEIAMSLGTNSRGVNTARISIFTDGAGKPWNLLEEFLVSVTTNQIYLLESELMPKLDAHMGYWLVVESVGRDARHGWKFNGIDPYGTNNGPVLRIESEDDVWTDRSLYGQQAFRVTARTNELALPHTAGLVFFGFLLMLGKQQCSLRRNDLRS
jgi:hypothetical protein